MRSARTRTPTSAPANLPPTPPPPTPCPRPPALSHGEAPQAGINVDGLRGSEPAAGQRARACRRRGSAAGELRVDEDVAEAAEHAVAVVAGKCQLVRARYPHEPRVPALVG